MIHWLVLAETAAPEIAQGMAPAGLLSSTEATQLAHMTVLKRRRDWLLGRRTAKELVGTVLAGQVRERMALDEIVVAADPDGAPFVQLTRAVDGFSAGRQPWSLSISHSHGVAFCALTINREGDTRAIGADIEFIEPRDDSFVADFFTADEMALVRQASRAERSTLVTAIWSAKEAVLKALRTGLRLDTRQVQCLVDTPLLPADAWTGLIVTVPDTIAPSARWAGWWRRPVEYPDFVLTLVEKQD